MTRVRCETSRGLGAGVVIRAGTFLIGILGMSLACAAPPAFATVTLAVRVVQGGLDVDFGTLTSTEASTRQQEVELTLTSTGGQYRVYQELPGLLINERGDRLPPGRLVMQTSQGMTGTPNTGGIVAVAESTQELFISNAQGSSDTLLVAYAMTAGSALPAGSYRGIMRYTVESLDTRAITTHTINLRVTISPAVSLDRDPSSPSRVVFEAADPGERVTSQPLRVAITNNAGSQTEITQELVRPLTNEKGDRFAVDALTYDLSAAQGSQTARPVAERAEVVLSDARGEARALQLSYAAAIPQDQPAGTYQGMLRLRLTSLGSAAPAELLVPIELTVNEIFTMSILPAEGASGLQFGTADPTQGPLERTMRIEIRTNIRRPYQVLAGLDHPLVLPSGEMLPRDSLVWSVPGTTYGTSLIRSDEPVAVGYAPVYQSDAKGSPDAFVLTYRLSIPKDARDGLYSSQLRFTITLS